MDIFFCTDKNQKQFFIFDHKSGTTIIPFLQTTTDSFYYTMTTMSTFAICCSFQQTNESSTSLHYNIWKHCEFWSIHNQEASKFLLQLLHYHRLYNTYSEHPVSPPSAMSTLITASNIMIVLPVDKKTNNFIVCIWWELMECYSTWLITTIPLIWSFSL